MKAFLLREQLLLEFAAVPLLLLVHFFELHQLVRHFIDFFVPLPDHVQVEVEILFQIPKL